MNAWPVIVALLLALPAAAAAFAWRHRARTEAPSYPAFARLDALGDERERRLCDGCGLFCDHFAGDVDSGESLCPACDTRTFRSRHRVRARWWHPDGLPVQFAHFDGKPSRPVFWRDGAPIACPTSSAVRQGPPWTAGDDHPEEDVIEPGDLAAVAALRADLDNLDDVESLLKEEEAES